MDASWERSAQIAEEYDRRVFPGFEAGISIIKKDIAHRIRKEGKTDVRKIAYFVDDSWGGYWQTNVEGTACTFRLGSSSTLQKADVVSFVERLRDISSRLASANSALAVDTAMQKLNEIIIDIERSAK